MVVNLAATMPCIYGVDWNQILTRAEYKIIGICWW